MYNLEEEQYDTYGEPIKGDKDPSTLLVDEYYINFSLVHNLSSYALPITTMVNEDGKWVKGFSLLVPNEEQKDPTCVHDDLMNAPFPS